MHTTKIRIKGMTCAHCVRKTQNILSMVPGVKTVTVKLKKLPFTDSVALCASLKPLEQMSLKAAVEAEGYTVTEIKAMYK